MPTSPAYFSTNSKKSTNSWYGDLPSCEVYWLRCARRAISSRYLAAASGRGGSASSKCAICRSVNDESTCICQFCGSEFACDPNLP